MSSLPPGFRTRKNSFIATSGLTTFLMPKAIDRTSTDWSGSGRFIASPAA